MWLKVHSHRMRRGGARRRTSMHSHGTRIALRGTAQRITAFTPDAAPYGTASGVKERWLGNSANHHQVSVISRVMVYDAVPCRARTSVECGGWVGVYRRCRRERECELEVSARDSMTYCLVDELTGHNEHWTLNANDVLSFARQVAVAMVAHIITFTSYCP